MSKLFSKIDDIAKLTFEPIRARVIIASKAVNSNGTTVILGANGTLYCSGIKTRLAYQNTTRNLSAALDACIKMGLLTEKAVAQHRADEKAYFAKRARQWAADSIQSNAETLGIKFNQAQLKIINQGLGK